MDPHLASEIAALPWFQDGISKEGRTRVSVLYDLSRLDVQLARKSIGIPQLLDEDDPHLGDVFLHLRSFARNDLELARRLVEYSWVSDGVSEDEEQALFSLRFIAEADVEAARQLADYPWMADLLTDREQQALRLLDSYAEVDPSYVKTVIDSAWIGDGIADDEFVKMALALPADMKDDLVNDLSEGLREYLIHSLVTLGKASSQHLLALGARDWVADGLTNEEAAFITSISRLSREHPQIYDGLLQERFAQTGTIRLPLSGEVNVWVFSNSPHLDEVNMLPPVEYAVGVAEEFLQVPLKTKDIVVMMVQWHEGTGSFRTSTHVRLSVSSAKKFYLLSSGIGSLYHEMAHYYFNGNMKWMDEGGATFIEDLAYEGDIGVSSPGGIYAARRTQLCMERHGLENIRHIHHVNRHNSREWHVSNPRACFYMMGSNFLHRTYDTIGRAALSSALGEIVSSVDIDASDEDKERNIYDAFMKHTPVSLQEDFKKLYRTLHGGPYAYDEPPATDDHGNAAGDATQVEVGEAVNGSLDYMFDFDYFRFEAWEGRKYRFSVVHEALGASSVGLFGPGGERGENQHWESRELGATGPEIVWVAPESDEYYLAVQNFGGKTGLYTLTISKEDTG